MKGDSTYLKIGGFGVVIIPHVNVIGNATVW